MRTHLANERRRQMADAHAMKVMEEIRALQALGIDSFAGLSKALNKAGIGAPRGGPWKPLQVKRVLARCT